MGLGTLIDSVGAVPVLGAAVGAPRAVIGASIWGGARAWSHLTNAGQPRRALDRIAEEGRFHATLGLAECVPLVGTAMHVLLTSLTRERISTITQSYLGCLRSIQEQQHQPLNPAGALQQGAAEAPAAEAPEVVGANWTDCSEG